MSTDHGFLPNPSLPDRATIKALCGQRQSIGEQATGFPLRDATSNAIIAWVKYGPFTCIDEGRTQDFVAKELARIPGCNVQAPRVFDAFMWTCWFGLPRCCIVMEYIDGSDCTSDDVDVVAEAVQTLISVRGPDMQPGHIETGLLVHYFFTDGLISPVHYPSVKDLQDHINKILKFMQRKTRVDLVTESKDGLFLCPCDVDPGNFRKRSSDGQMFALDFFSSCFLPPSFFALAMFLSPNRFSKEVAMKVTHPSPKYMLAMANAGLYCIQFSGPHCPVASKLHMSSN
ncbi:hypothetical protein ONZ45_g11353 [Pleurotus djamor]|nr:hypothetical protein ONZ45_g11353 [Pleurotus djamor]